MDDVGMMQYAGKSVQVSSWVLTGYLKKSVCYLIGKQSDGKFVFVFENPVTKNPVNMSIKSEHIDSITLSSPPSFSYDDATYEFGDLCDQLFSSSSSTISGTTASAPSFAMPKRKVSVDECNTTCPKCGSPAYQGFSSLECSNCDVK